ncbi:MAG TPA: RluA family pseudouridine synthase [Polyangiaceae bacterium]|nr:RluA family pseudouridine synthase [Polyangiaceae bacterium]
MTRDGHEPELRVHVPESARGLRLDRFLAQALEGEPAPLSQLSRSELKRWIDEGRVTVDGATKKAADKVRPGDEVRVRPALPPPTRALPDASVPFEVLYEDDEVVVVNKPAGVVVHPAAGHATGTLVNGLLARGYFDRDPDLHASDDDDDAEAERSRPGIVHRLDKDTSGVMVVARTAFAREALKAQFAAHTIDRAYEAVCVGALASTTFATLHGRNPGNRLLFSSRVRDGKRAVTHVVAVRSYRGLATRITCRLETGRTHQIRVHLSDAGHPLLGDVAYGGPPRDPGLARIARALGRQALHARRLGFVHPRTGAARVFEAALPDDLALAIAALEAL